MHLYFTAECLIWLSLYVKHFFCSAMNIKCKNIHFEKTNETCFNRHVLLLIFLLSPLTAVAIPLARPPPLVGMRMACTSGHCSRSSKPSVPWWTTADDNDSIYLYEAKTSISHFSFPKAQMCSYLLFLTPCEHS